MKARIHLIPTNKPSRVYLKGFQVLSLDDKIEIVTDEYSKNQHIYITSDEEIKEGDYAYHKTFGVGKITNVNGEECFVTIKLSPTDGSVTTPWKRNIPDIKKIILTTDTDLIKEGIQAIDYEFLQWFVKNSSCEKIEARYKEGIYDLSMGYPSIYKIIIPSEEAKQETLEKADENFLNNTRLRNHKTLFIEGAKWRQEIMYSEKQMDDAYDKGFKDAKERMYSEEEVLDFTQKVIQQYKFGNTNIEQLDLLKETLQLFKNK